MPDNNQFLEQLHNLLHAELAAQENPAIPAQPVQGIDPIAYNNGMYGTIDELFNYSKDYWHPDVRRGRAKELIKEKKYIQDDVDIMGKISENRDMVVLTSEEIKKAVVNQRPDYKIFESLLRDSANASGYAIGSVLRGSFNPKVEPNDNYIVLGAAIEGKTYDNNNDARNAWASRKSPSAKLNFILFNLTNGKLVIKEYGEMTNHLSSAPSSVIINVLSQLKYNIIDSQLSGRVFGFANGKAKLVGSVVSNVKIEHGSSVKLGQDSYYAIVYDENTNKNVKFCLSDLQVVLPNIKGYNFPKDKTIRKGLLVTIKGNNTPFVVRAVHINPSSKRLSKRGTTRALDVLQIDSTTNQYDSRKVYAKNVKLV